MMEQFSRVGAAGLQQCQQLGASGIFLTRVLLRYPRVVSGFKLLVEQLFFVGVLSLSIILVSGLFIGMVLGLQGVYTLQRFGAEAQLGQLVALSVVRELGPVVTALLFAGRAGSALTAEIGLMRATDQIASMEMMAVDPLWRVISPRFWAGVISMPILAMIFNVVAIWGGYIVGVKWLGVDMGAFWNNMQSTVDFQQDILNGIIKTVVFGFVVTWIAVYQGFYSVPTAPGISLATTRSVVYASLAVLGLDFILTAMMLKGW
jgi:phospholipid/cholesterol/gamma-HCH transport system permease protein